MYDSRKLTNLRAVLRAHRYGVTYVFSQTVVLRISTVLVLERKLIIALIGTQSRVAFRLLGTQALLHNLITISRMGHLRVQRNSIPPGGVLDLGNTSAWRHIFPNAAARDGET